MILGYIVLGAIVGFTTFLAAIVLGMSFWPALLLYSLAGLTGIIAVPLMRLFVRSVAGRSSRLTDARIPVVGIDLKAALPNATVADIKGDRLTSAMTILAVDDDPFILELIPMISARAGFSKVTPAASGELALEVLAETGSVFDCLLIDINMPGIDGIELCARVRKMPAYRHTPIIMLTAMRDMEHLDLAFKAGATDYSNKPFDIDNLAARLRFAQASINARQGRNALPNDNQLPHPDAGQDHGFGMADGIRIDGIRDLVVYAALENYLAQLTRTRLANTQVLAVKVDRAEALYASLSSRELNQTLEDVADAVGCTFKMGEKLMAHAGNGTFLIVARTAIRKPSIILEAELQRLFTEKNSKFDNRDPSRLAFSIGEPVSPIPMKAQRARTAFDRAIASAENRFIDKQAGPPLEGIHRRGA